MDLHYVTKTLTINMKGEYYDDIVINFPVEKSRVHPH